MNFMVDEWNSVEENEGLPMLKINIQKYGTNKSNVDLLQRRKQEEKKNKN
jgi:hypothetical protein